MKYEPNKSLAEALKAAKGVSEDGVIEHSQLDSKQLDILKKSGWLTPVIRGWYLLTKPEPSGATTIWYVGFWPFVRSYLLNRFGKQEYCLSAESSIDLHTGENHIGRQITVLTKKASNQNINLPQDTSLLLYQDLKNFPETVKLNGIYVMPLPLALCRLSHKYFSDKPLNAELALRMLPSVAEISRILLDGGLVTVAGRLAGAFRTIGESQKADQIIRDMQAAGLSISEVNPFEKHEPVLKGLKFKSPYVGRIEALWKKMRGPVIEAFEPPQGLGATTERKLLTAISDRYKHDAYNSLSIEGYEVTEALIQQIADGEWHPDNDPQATEQKAAMAAKGYRETFLLVLDSVKKLFTPENPGKIFEDDLQDWYRDLFSASVHAGILKVADLAGYRNGPVYIKGARHVPPGKEAVLDSMETLFKLIKEEEHPAVRAVLGHFIFVYIHPYMDGNGRIGRFLLNLMLISGGYCWTIIRAEQRPQYMEALEAASTEGNIAPFAKFVRSEHDYWESHPPVHKP